MKTFVFTFYHFGSDTIFRCVASGHDENDAKARFFKYLHQNKNISLLDVSPFNF